MGNDGICRDMRTRIRPTRNGILRCFPIAARFDLYPHRFLKFCVYNCEFCRKRLSAVISSISPNVIATHDIPFVVVLCAAWKVTHAPFSLAVACST